MSAITIIGTGSMARGISTRALAGGNAVQLLDRELAKAESLAAELGAEVGADGRAEVTTGAVGDPISGDLVVLAVPYDAAAPLVRQYGDQLHGKVVVDITNPVDMATFADLVTPAGSSGAQEIAKVAPTDARVVKAFNTTFASTLVEGSVGGLPLDVFIAGDDDAAKAAVASLIDGGGLRAIDTGGLSQAHTLELLGLLHMQLQMSRGTNFATAIKIMV